MTCATMEHERLRAIAAGLPTALLREWYAVAVADLFVSDARGAPPPLYVYAVLKAMESHDEAPEFAHAMIRPIWTAWRADPACAPWLAALLDQLLALAVGD